MIKYSFLQEYSLRTGFMDKTIDRYGVAQDNMANKIASMNNTQLQKYNKNKKVQKLMGMNDYNQRYDYARKHMVGKRTSQNKEMWSAAINPLKFVPGQGLAQKTRYLNSVSVDNYLSRMG